MKLQKTFQTYLFCCILNNFICILPVFWLYSSLLWPGLGLFFCFHASKIARLETQTNLFGLYHTKRGSEDCWSFINIQHSWGRRNFTVFMGREKTLRRRSWKLDNQSLGDQFSIYKKSSSFTWDMDRKPWTLFFCTWLCLERPWKLFKGFQSFKSTTKATLYYIKSVNHTAFFCVKIHIEGNVHYVRNWNVVYEKNNVVACQKDCCSDQENSRTCDQIRG